MTGPAAPCEVCGVTPDNVATLEKAAHHVFHCDHQAGDYRCVEFVRDRTDRAVPNA